MNDDRELQCLDDLLSRKFKPVPGEAPPGFEARVMATVMNSKRELSLWDFLRAAASPILVSGWAAALVLALVAFSGLNASNEITMAALVNGESVVRWLAL